MDSILTQLSNHRSVRFFDQKAVSDELLNSLISIGQTASTSSNLQAYSIIKVDSPTKRESIFEISGKQQHVLSAPIFLVFCADLYRLKVAGQIEGLEFNTDYMESFIVGTVDTAILAQNIMVAAELNGLGGVYIGGIRNNMQAMIDVLELPDYTVPLFGMCLGYPDQSRLPDRKPRFSVQSILHTDSYDTSKVKGSVEEYNQIMKDYYEKRNSKRRDISWSAHTLNEYSKPRRVDVRGSIEKQNFKLF